MGAELMLIWVTARPEVCYARMKQRNSDRDTLKLENWEAFVKTQNFTAPSGLLEAGAVDKFIIIDNSEAETLNECMDRALAMIRE